MGKNLTYGQKANIMLHAFLLENGVTSKDIRRNRRQPKKKISYVELAKLTNSTRKTAKKQADKKHQLLQSKFFMN